MVAPLIALVASLIAQKEQEAEQKRQNNLLSHKAEQDTIRSIEARRAGRAGDSGYMQSAAGDIAQYPQLQKSDSGAMMRQIGGALASQRDEPKQTEPSVADQEATNEARASSGYVAQPKLQGLNYDEDERKRNYFNNLA